MANQSPLVRKDAYSEKPYLVESEPSPAGGEIPNPELYLAPRSWTPLVGRILFSSLFIFGAFSNFTQTAIDYAANTGVPLPEVLVPVSGIIALLGGLSVLLGYKARIGASLLIVFLIPVTLMMHAFWNVADPGARAVQQVMFMKNVALIGGALYIAFYGSGSRSLD
jgi:putative oxidoreductase